MAQRTRSKDVTVVNREFYDSLYKTPTSWLSVVRALTSFDQQTKAKPNYIAAMELVVQGNGASGKLRVLDYGAGWGTFLLKWPAAIASCWCYDISRESVKQCGSAGRLLRREIAEWSGVEREFDLVCCSHVLEHVPDDLELLQRLRSITRPGGIVLLNVPINEVRQDPKHARRYDSRSLRSVVEAAGLVVVLERETDQLSTYLSKREAAAMAQSLTKAGWRTLRLIAALMPYGLIAKVNSLLSSSQAPSQLIVGARNGP